MIILVQVSRAGKLQKEFVWLTCLRVMYAQQLTFAAPIHFIGVKKDAELRGSDSTMQAALCSCELQIQWKGGTWV